MATKKTRKEGGAAVAEEPTVLSTGSEMLAHKLTDEELLAAGQELAALHDEMASHESVAKQTKDALKAEESRIVSAITRAAGRVRSKQDYRETPTVTRGDIAAKVAIVYRQDTGDEIRRRQLTSEEIQRLEQPELFAGEGEDA